jgi:replicative DNA helicase
MGVDSTPRKVINSWFGVDDLYRIKQNKGDDYVVTYHHKLALERSINIYTDKTKKLNKENRICVKKQGEKLVISVEDYLQKNKYFKSEYKGYKVSGWELSKKEIKIDPYWLGLWLGDGAISDTGITTQDIEVIQYIEEYAKKLDMRFSEHKGKNRCSEFNIVNITRNNNKNYLKEALKFYNLLNNKKFIPEEFKYNNKEIRLQVLAGLLDTDGYLTSNTFEIITKYIKLKDDILYLARSLGLYAVAKLEIKSINKLNFCGEYWRIRISGDNNIIPTKVKRRKAKKRKQIKNILRTGITIEKENRGRYFGISLEEGTDQLYILGDGTVTHNSAMSQNMQMSWISRNIPVIKFGTEMTIDSEMDRTMAMRLNISPNELYKEKRDDRFNSKVERALQGFSQIKNYLHVDESSLSLGDVDNLIRLGKEHFRKEGVYKNNDEYTMIVIDLASMIKEINGEYGDGVEKGATELHNITKNNNIHSLLIVQANENRARGGLRFKKPEEIDHQVFVGPDIKGGAGWFERCRMVLSLYRPLMIKKQYFPDRMEEWLLEEDILWLHACKNNNGPEFRLPFIFNAESFRILPYIKEKKEIDNETCN